MKWRIKLFLELKPVQLYELLRLRVDVFVVEQNCPYPEIDGLDIHPETLHLTGTDRTGRISAYLRILPPGLRFEEVTIGRVVVAQKERDKGMCHQMMTLALERITSVWPEERIKISAQVYLKRFYESHGFVPVSNSYLEDGIPHIDMRHPGGRS